LKDKINNSQCIRNDNNRKGKKNFPTGQLLLKEKKTFGDFLEVAV